MTDTDTIDRGGDRAPHRTLRDVVLLVAASSAAWWAWLGWDHTYYTDAATGYPAGPYRPWQVVGCVLTLLVVAALAYRSMRPLVVGVVMTFSFTFSYAVSTVPGDDTGLSGVGVLLVLAGLGASTALVGAVVSGLGGGQRGADGTVSEVSRVEVVLWVLGCTAVGALFPGLGIVLAVSVVYTRMRRCSRAVQVATVVATAALSAAVNIAFNLA